MHVTKCTDTLVCNITIGMKKQGDKGTMFERHNYYVIQVFFKKIVYLFDNLVCPWYVGEN